MKHSFFQRMADRLEPSLEPLLASRHDPWLPTLAIGLALFGWVMITSASIDSPLGMYHFSIRQGIFLVISLLAACVVVRIPFRDWRIMALPIYFSSITLMIIVLLIGQDINGSRRWISLPGPLPALQPSEIGKIGLALYMARFVTLYRKDLTSKTLAFYRPLLALGPLVLLLFIGRDFGSAFIYTVAVGGILFVAETRWSSISIAAIIAILGISLMIIAEPYRIVRLMSYGDPWQDPFGTGYQLSQSLIGFGRGGLTGIGLGNSIQKLGFLPEPHNDFILAIIAEELGILGVIAVIGAIVGLCFRVFTIARQADIAQRTFASFFCYTVAFILTSQMMINLGVAIGSLPTKGLTLPLISYGGSSLLVIFVLLAMVFRIDMETRLLMQWQASKKGNSPRQQALQMKYRGQIHQPRSPVRLPG